MSPFVWCWLCLPIICIIFWQFTWIRTKGHLISEWNFCAFKSPKKSTNLMTDLCPSFMGQKSDKNLVGFLGDLKTPKLHSEINWPLVALGQKSIFLLFFSGSTLSQGLISFWKILCITSLCLVMAPHYSHFHFDPFCYFIFKTSFTQLILYFFTSLKIIIIIIRGCCFLWGAFLEGALLEGAFLEGALLERCVFRGCSFRGVRF